MRRSDDILRCWSSHLHNQTAAVRFNTPTRATNYDLDDSPAQRSFIYFVFHYYHHSTEVHTQRASTLYPSLYSYSNHTCTHTSTHDGVSVQVLNHYYHTSAQHLGQSKELGTFLFVYTHTWFMSGSSAVFLAWSYPLRAALRAPVLRFPNSLLSRSVPRVL
jgi:hypothetical protein